MHPSIQPFRTLAERQRQEKEERGLGMAQQCCIPDDMPKIESPSFLVPPTKKKGHGYPETRHYGFPSLHLYRQTIDRVIVQGHQGGGKGVKGVQAEGTKRIS